MAELKAQEWSFLVDKLAQELVQLLAKQTDEL